MKFFWTTSMVTCFQDFSYGTSSSISEPSSGKAYWMVKARGLVSTIYSHEGERCDQIPYPCPSESQSEEKKRLCKVQQSFAICRLRCQPVESNLTGLGK